MRTINNEAHSFIIKVWLEETTDANRPIVWRGHITHVPDGTRRYAQSLDDILDFVIPYLADMGADINQGEEPRWWLRLWKRKR